MKIYVIYAKIPYDIFIENNYKDIFDMDVFNLTLDKKYYMGIYAWTKNKKDLKIFLNERKNNNFYTFEKINLSSDDFEVFKNKYYQEELDLHEFYNSFDKCVHIISTNLEYEVSSETPMIDDILYGTIDKCSDYYILNDKYINALDIISYTSFYDLAYVSFSDILNDDEKEIRESYADGNSSYGFTVYGHKYYNILYSHFVSFLVLFHEML